MKKNQGFTIIELFVVILVILIIAAILIPTTIEKISKKNKSTNNSNNLNSRFNIEDYGYLIAGSDSYIIHDKNSGIDYLAIYKYGIVKLEKKSNELESKE